MAASNVIALDVGEKRIGVALASSHARLASPIMTIEHDEHVTQKIRDVIEAHQAHRVVVGLPRNMNNQDTAQTGYVRRFAAGLMHEIRTITLEFQDEAESSKKAERELMSRNKPYAKGDIDALAATYILQDYLDQHGGHVL